jgi:hypothetical protein
MVFLTEKNCAPCQAEGGGARLPERAAEGRAASCRGQSLLIDGNENHVQFRGHCRRAHLNGNDNTIVLHAVVSVISVNGTYNQGYVSAARNPMTPRLHDNGHANVPCGTL